MSDTIKQYLAQEIKKLRVENEQRSKEYNKLNIENCNLSVKIEQLKQENEQLKTMMNGKIKLAGCWDVTKGSCAEDKG